MREIIAGFHSLPHSARLGYQNVDACLAEENYVLLTQVLRRFPPEHGLLEVLGYFVLAAQDHERHYIMADSFMPFFTARRHGMAAAAPALRQECVWHSVVVSNIRHERCHKQRC